MIDNSLILKEIAQLRDIVNLGVCVGAYQTCNGKQFKHMPASDFINFLNLKLDSNVQKITSAIFLLQFMFRSIAKNLTKEPCKDVVFILMCSMYFIT